MREAVVSAARAEEFSGTDSREMSVRPEAAAGVWTFPS